MRFPRRLPRTYLFLLIMGGITGLFIKDLRLKYGPAMQNFVLDLVKSYKVQPLIHPLLGDQLSTVFGRRNALLQKVCAHNLEVKTQTEVKNVQYIINTDHKLVWCNMLKAASTTWFYHFAKLAGYEPEDIRHSPFTPIQFLHKNGYPRPTAKYLKDALENDEYTSFLIARDPFERLLSSYVDKIVDQSEINYDKLRCEITGVRDNGWCKPTFSEFVDYVILEHESDRKVDEYWDTYSNICTPCLVNYTYILHLNNLHEEQLMIFDKMKAPTRLVPVRRHYSHLQYKTELPSYYGELTKQQLDSLIKIFRQDFLLFGFSYKRYYDYITSNVKMNKKKRIKRARN